MADSEAETRSESDFPQEPARQLPSRVGPVRLLRQLGRGGMGVVWLGHHELLDREVAVKFLLHLTPTDADPTFEALIRGARAAAGCHHPGLNQVFHADVIDGVPFLVLELVNGRDLSEIVSERGALELPVARTLLSEICEAASELHDRNLVHRDIKPANVMVSRDGHCVLTDFGLAKVQDQLTFGTKMGSRAGTIAYMAPEMFEGIASVRTDVYAIGATAFQILSGRPPFRGDSEEVLRRKGQLALETGELHARGVPAGVIDVLERAMNRSAMYRLKSARHLHHAFENAWEKAGVIRAHPTTLAAIVPSPALSSLQARPSESASTYYEQLSAMAERRQTSPVGSAIADGTHQLALPDPAIIGKLARERQQVRRASVVAIALGGLLTVLIGIAAGSAFVRFNVWFETSRRTREVAVFWANPVMYAIVLAGGAVAMLISLRFFQAMTPRRARGQTSVHCGECGYERRGVTDRHCSECGHLIGEVVQDERSAWTARARIALESAFMPGLFACAAMMVGSVFLSPQPVETGGQSIGWIVFLAGMTATGVFLGVKLFDRSEQEWFRRCGKSWCPACGFELRRDESGRCANCSRPI
ncbi:MAG: serine/threonine protein kinase [Phycisphaeraceae bacterium]|nr:serine/threonine protein kinase [Phycisphaeraceae bacterium]